MSVHDKATPGKPADSLSYRDSGVDIDAGNRLVERIKPAVAKTHRPGVLAGLGGFGALFELPLADYRERLQDQAKRQAAVASPAWLPDFLRDGVVRARVTAPPAGGAANDALVRLLAETRRVGRSRISIVRGAITRTPFPAAYPFPREWKTASSSPGSSPGRSRAP